MAEAPTPRLHGWLLRFVSRLMASPASGPLRRALGTSVIEKKLATIDFVAEADPLPLYEPRSYRPRGRDGGRGS